ncbi:ABC transporter permease, partial [Escherichia coli]
MQLASSHVTGRGTRAGLYCRPAADLSLYGKIMSVVFSTRARWRG